MAVVGTTTLQPNQTTTVTVEFTMHEGMGGPHLFDLPIRTNDPTQPEKHVWIASNWVPQSAN